jgi:hypothetical protein
VATAKSNLQTVLKFAHGTAAAQEIHATEMKLVNRCFNWWLVTVGFLLFVSLEATVIYFYLKFCGIL